MKILKLLTKISWAAGSIAFLGYMTLALWSIFNATLEEVFVFSGLAIVVSTWASWVIIRNNHFLKTDREINIIKFLER